MENQTKLIETINTVSAHQDVLQYLLLAVFDEMPKEIKIRYCQVHRHNTDRQKQKHF